MKSIETHIENEDSSKEKKKTILFLVLTSGEFEWFIFVKLLLKSHFICTSKQYLWNRVRPIVKKKCSWFDLPRNKWLIQHIEQLENSGIPFSIVVHCNKIDKIASLNFRDVLFVYSTFQTSVGFF